jgi:anti-anti-sigma regulatory factor
MPEAAAKPVFLADAAADPVLVRVVGRACFQNSRCLRDFFAEMAQQGKRRFVLDFAQCSGMDSTFLGVLAGAALKLRGSTPSGSLVIRRANPRNLELIQNLGLNKLLTVEPGDCHAGEWAALGCPPEKDELANAKLVLEAHQHLVAADAANGARFQDVLTFLQKRVQQG